MPVIKMQKVALISHKSISEDLLEFLQDEGVMEISPNEETVDIESPKFAYEEAEVKFAVDNLLPFASKEEIKAVKNPGTTEEITKGALHTDFREIIDECKKLEDEMGSASNEKQQLIAHRKKISPWKDLDMNLSERETDTSVVTFGQVSPNVFEEFENKLSTDLPRTNLLEVGASEGQLLVVAIIWKEDKNTFDQAAAQVGWTDIDLPQVDESPAKEIARVDNEIKSLDAKEEKFLSRKSELAKSIPNLARLAQYMHWIDMKQSVRSEFSKTDQTVMLTGWIESKKIDEINEKLITNHWPLTTGQNSPAIALMPIEPKADEEPPMQIKNRNWIAPFEAVTRLYGLPQGSEMDPTRPLMPFFILYFGLCLTDAGYGAVLALIMAGLILKFKLKRQEQKLIWLLFYAGIATFLVSIPFGGWFGMTPDQAPGWMTKIIEGDIVRFKGQVWDLNKDVDFFRNLAISLGVIQILFGIFLSGYWKFIHGKRFEAFAAHFTVHMFVALLALQMLTEIPYLNYPTYAVGLLFIWGQGSGKWFIRPLIGILGTVNFLIGVMSNTLSYLRILALGLATGALAFAINQIGAVIAGLLPSIIGVPVFIMILFFGHLTSIALNCLGSFVHSGRLQFIEFFGQFFQGGGKEFAPFKRSTRSIL
ncbi:hypothetical protein HOF56_01860 [Candidatus Peribacteria bacterium]|jgi:V/A-type H+/Na+-transporting ATPase subunit I|nr:hypothetical protein [Candidatus Peribacteria bacterium]MBT4020829.1 hypothetical protein [Candidatus Peribacteria bacterium]MBT4241118.1 hypothetical protein [Candidatus Peribacteria bacterium]MBT4473840.1 hypothetical protein [Candidatus Peribacteria bacterium]